MFLWAAFQSIVGTFWLLTSFKAWPSTSIGTVCMAEVADVIGICKLPDQGVVLPHDARRAGLDTVGTINIVGTLDAVVWPPACTGDVHGLGQTFWMALDAFRIFHKLPRFPLQDVALVHALPASAHILAGDTVRGLRAPAAFRGA